jgi:putative hemolysin
LERLLKSQDDEKDLNIMKTAYILPAMATAATLMLAGCGSPRHEPREVAAANPTVTYKYHGDQELLQANEKAETYCSQYKSVPRTVRIERGDDGRAAVFECVPTGSMTTVETFNPNTPYTYHTDEELLDTSRSAQRYCTAHGGRAVETVTTAPDGSRSVTYSCR